jgi:hypothetical protein
MLRTEHDHRTVASLPRERIVTGIPQPHANRSGAALDTLKKLRNKAINGIVGLNEPERGRNHARHEVRILNRRKIEENNSPLNSASSARPAATASVVLPMPPGPMMVTNRKGLNRPSAQAQPAGDDATQHLGGPALDGELRRPSGGIG